MRDHKGKEWITQPCPKDWNIACTTVLHTGRKQAHFIEILTAEVGGQRFEARREYTCVPCHLALLVAAKKIVGG